MNKYEVIIIVQPEASEEAIAQVSERAQQQVTRNGGIILNLENWGRKKLAYEIEHHPEGTYLKMDCEAPGDVIGKLARHFALSEQVVRHQILKQAERKSTAG